MDWTTLIQPWQESQLATFSKPTKPSPQTDTETIDLIKIGETMKYIQDLLYAGHRKYHKVFSRDLRGGYNGYYRTHVCKLNWDSS